MPYHAVVNLRVGGALQELQLLLKELSDRLVDQLVLLLGCDGKTKSRTVCALVTSMNSKAQAGNPT